MGHCKHIQILKLGIMQTGFSDCKENNLTVNNGKISIKLSMEKLISSLYTTYKQLKRYVYK